MITLISLTRIDANPWQTRQGEPDPAYVKELALDIAANGLLQTPAGRLVIGEKILYPEAYGGVAAALADEPLARVQLAFGHNRLAAFAWLHSLHGHTDIPGDFSKFPVDINRYTDEQMADFAWSENEKRRDHTPMERALAIQKRIESFGWSHDQIAEHLGISRPVVSNALALLELPDEARAKLHDGTISERQAHALLALLRLPASLREQAEAGWTPDTKPSNIMADTLSGKTSSDGVRNRVEQLLRVYCQDLKEAAFEIDQYVGDIPKCRVCDKRVLQRDVCMDPKCLEVKNALAKFNYLARASQVCGIPPMEADDQRSIYDLTSFSALDIGRGDLPNILQARCPNLRLVYVVRNPQSADMTNPAGFPRATILCSKRSGSCTCLAGLAYKRSHPDPAPVERRSDTPDQADRDDQADRPAQPVAASKPTTAETPAALEEAARAARAEKRMAAELVSVIQADVARRLAVALEDRWPLAWRLMMALRMGYAQNFEKTTNLETWTDIAYYMAELTAAAITPAMPDSVDRMVKRVNEALEMVGLNPYTTEQIEAMKSGGQHG